MTERILGIRLNNYHEPKSHMNISVNMYPITSAIAIKDVADDTTE